jgi:hypothetical protein
VRLWIQTPNLLVGATIAWNKENWHTRELGKMKLMVNLLPTLMVQVQSMPIVIACGILLRDSRRNRNVRGIHVGHGASVHQRLAQL